MASPAMSNATHTFDITSAVPSDHSSSKQDERIARSTRSTFATMQKLLREPLLHFAVLGGLIFAGDRILHPPAKDDKVIVVTKAMRQSFIDNFDEDKESAPTDAQLEKMIDSWVGSEILYREGKALGIDRGDEMIRDRIAFKLQLLIFDQVRAPQATEDQLRAWFAANHARFDEPERVGFYMTAPTDQASAERQLADIIAQRESEDVQKATRAVLGRPVASLAASFGEGFRDALLALPQGQWNVVQSKDGWHAVRLDSRRPARLARFEDVQDQVASIWKTEETRKLAWDAVLRLKTSYKVRYEQ